MAISTDSLFHSSFHIWFFIACRPLLGLDRMSLKRKYLGTLPFATGFDGDGALFPVALDRQKGIVDGVEANFPTAFHGFCMRHLSDSCQATYQVLHANESEFEVISDEGTNIVGIRNCSCLCRGWQLYGLPCAYAVAALLSCRQVHRFTESCFTVATYRKTYSQTIHPIPDKSPWKELSGGDTNSKNIKVVTNPSKSLRPPG
ncbi:Zinc finger, SWIM-type [Dillenia turbinata]|uniref:Zinc finger, SWIM-type n=1 Tax=Dillenia turbinata TaxID=194707 RepID=A0AAN8USZ8_9MAGN